VRSNPCEKRFTAFNCSESNQVLPNGDPTAPNAPVGVAPTCDPLKDTQYAVLAYNFGSLREPVVFQFWIPSVLLFGLSLLGLHWFELDARARKRAASTPVPVPTPGA